MKASKSKPRKSWDVNDDLKGEFEIVMLDDLDVIDEVALAELEDE